MKQPILLDTCAVIFSANEQLKGSAQSSLDQADENGIDIYVSPITAWEIGILATRGRLVLATSPEAWFDRVLRNGARLAAMGPDILISSSFLPDCALRDPADRIMAATARANGYRLMTRDGPLLDYGSQGHLNVIAC
jgi:PIN domain nuclease of toxin-antitoxin system